MLLGIEFFLLTRFARIIKLDYNISNGKIFIGLKIIKFFNGEMGVLITSLFLWFALRIAYYIKILTVNFLNKKGEIISPHYNMK